MALLKECEIFCSCASYKHPTPKGVRDVLFVRQL